LGTLYPDNADFGEYVGEYVTRKNFLFIHCMEVIASFEEALLLA